MSFVRLLVIFIVLFLSVAAVHPQSRKPDLILRNVAVIDVRTGRSRPGRDVIIRNGKIASIMRAGAAKAGRDAQVLDLSGKYLIPGLIDSHYHLVPSHWPPAVAAARRRFAFMNGVTTVRDMAGDAIDIKALADQAVDPDTELPRIYFSAFMAGPQWFNDRRAAEMSHGMTPGTAPWARMIDDKTDITKAVADAKATGAVALKLYERLTADQVKALTAEAHRQGMKVWSHAAVFPAGPSDVVDAGVDSISHSDGLIYAAVTPVWEEYRKLNWKNVKPDAPQVVALLKEMRRKGVVLDATLHIYDENVEYDLEEKPENQNKWYVDQQEWAYQVTRLAHQLGVTIVAGTDYPERPRRRNGVANIHFEMELLTNKAGMTAAEALRAATLNGARLLGVDRLYGSIEPGKIADLVVIDGDPLADIRNTRRVAYIIKGGEPHKFEAVKMPEQ